jgi:hypothetical protein
MDERVRAEFLAQFSEDNEIVVNASLDMQMITEEASFVPLEHVLVREWA